MSAALLRKRSGCSLQRSLSTVLLSIHESLVDTPIVNTGSRGTIGTTATVGTPCWLPHGKPSARRRDRSIEQACVAKRGDCDKHRPSANRLIRGIGFPALQHATSRFFWRAGRNFQHKATDSPELAVSHHAVRAANAMHKRGRGSFKKTPVPFSGSASQGSSCENVATETRCLRRRGRSLARRLDRCVANRFGWSGNTILYETHVPRTADLIGNTAPNNATSEGSDQGRE